MPYFSFSIKRVINIFKNKNITLNKKYYSKDIKIYNSLKSKNISNSVNFVKFEKRIECNKLGFKILFCLPPNIGLGDIIEYGSAVNNIKRSNKFENVSVAFSGKNSFILKNFFHIDNIYPDVVSEDDFLNFDNVFHLTLQIQKLKQQKYLRSDIANEICKYFGVLNHKTILKNKHNYIKKINKISIFPISTSPLRSMSVNLLNNLIKNLSKKYEIEILLYDKSNISQYIKSRIINDKYKIVDPPNVKSLISYIKKIQYGIFVDSGPLHVAKIFSKLGSFIETSVSHKVLLKNYNSINTINNKYYSKYCTAPCGLIDIFSYNNSNGCYDTLKLKKKNILDLKNFNSLQRGSVKNNLINYLFQPVGCVKYLESEKAIYQINNHLSKIIL
ncbi:MAG: hypothetical protein CMI96_00440 [Pelagibacteraceae bacterium]|nr:hypothetical protein [Pelagibacteraceae bacterium]|tara:strand:+ start:10696 stop:11856 length:1161 start_codon:yes stop_codon:yes gene_type:complete